MHIIPAASGSNPVLKNPIFQANSNQEEISKKILRVDIKQHDWVLQATYPTTFNQSECIIIDWIE